MSAVPLQLGCPELPAGYCMVCGGNYTAERQALRTLPGYGADEYCSGCVEDWMGRIRKATIVDLLKGNLKEAIALRQSFGGMAFQGRNTIREFIDRWIGRGRGDSADRKVLHQYLDLHFPKEKYE